LRRWDPFIQFFGLPDEAQMGFELTGSEREHGELTFQQPDIWTLRWIAPPVVINETWSLPPDDPDAGRGDLDFPDRAARTRGGKDRRKTRGRRATDRDDP
jgi:hypothetical protein